MRAAQQAVIGRLGDQAEALKTPSQNGRRHSEHCPNARGYRLHSSRKPLLTPHFYTGYPPRPADLPTSAMVNYQAFEACQPIKILETARFEQMLQDAFNAEDAELSAQEELDYNEEASERPAKRHKSGNEGSKPLGKWAHKHTKRRLKREHQTLERGYAPSQKTIEKINLADAPPIPMGLKLGDFKPKLGAYVAMNTPKAEKENAARIETIESVVSEHGFTVIEWDGR
ncbi:hypothetical protein M413DRAFT_14979, partial [Hebeloma cylindrosporum]